MRNPFRHHPDPAAMTVEKAGPSGVRAWLDDVLLQADICRRQGITAPLSISQEEVRYLEVLRAVAEAAAELQAFHSTDIAPFAPERLARLTQALERYRK
jgi:hypothetical protein